MPLQPNSKISDFFDDLAGSVKGEIRTDPVSRVLYSTDASIYQIAPLGVFFPKHVDEISAALEVAEKFQISIVPRGSGSSLAGQAIGPGLVIECSRHLDQLLKYDPEVKTAVVQPGLILSQLNAALAGSGLKFGPDPASDERATLAGVIANNATGAHSICYGMAADHLISVEVVLSDGSVAEFSEVELDQAQQKARGASREAGLYRAALSIREDKFHQIISNWPKTWRRASGYNLNYLLPWSASSPPQWNYYQGGGGSDESPYPPIQPGSINLASLIAGSEGTLGIIRKAKVRLVSRPRFTSLVLLAFPDLVSACDQVTNLLELHPSAIELIPANMIKLAGNIPAYAHQISIIDPLITSEGGIPNLLAVEFAGDEISKVIELSRRTASQFKVPSLIAAEETVQGQIWNVRKVGLGILMSIPGDLKPIPFVEDVSVPVSKLSQFVRRFQAILDDFGTHGDFYAHASAGCLHIRPLVNLKNTTGIEKMRSIAYETMELISDLGGAPSGEHGDGIARSEWLIKTFGAELVAAFQDLKSAVDPHEILNPGKIVNPDQMDQQLRYGSGYSTRELHTVMDFSTQNGFAGAIEMCNGAGVCRKLTGVMCPSFQATREELHTTRGRANLLREFISGRTSPVGEISQEDIFQALDLCLACKGCKAECPSGVDMAKLKYEFLEAYYQPNSAHRHPVRDYFFAYIGELSRLGSTLRPVTNYLLSGLQRSGMGERWLGLSGNRDLPILSYSRIKSSSRLPENLANSQADHPAEQVLYLKDPFTEYYRPEISLQARELLGAAGIQVQVIPVIGSGRTKLSKGFTRAAHRQARKVIDAIQCMDPQHEMAILGVEPSEIYTLRDEYPDFFPGEQAVRTIAARVFMLDEYLLRPDEGGNSEKLRIGNLFHNKYRPSETLYLHTHCYQKSQPPSTDGYPAGSQATVALLERVGYRVELIDAGCCGMAGAFGYEAEHYDLSMAVGELSLFPSLRELPQDAPIAAVGFSCLEQIAAGTGRQPSHFVSLIHDRMHNSEAH